MPLAELIDPAQRQPGDPAVPRPERLARAIRDVMWGGSAPVDYPSPVESGDDPLARRSDRLLRGG